MKVLVVHAVVSSFACFLFYFACFLVCCLWEYIVVCGMLDLVVQGKRVAVDGELRPATIHTRYACMCACVRV
jgi:hypothetical protein